MKGAWTHVGVQAMQVWLGKIGDLLDLKADGDDVAQLGETLREVAASTDALGESFQATAAQLSEEMAGVARDARGWREGLAQRVAAAEAGGPQVLLCAGLGCSPRGHVEHSRPDSAPCVRVTADAPWARDALVCVRMQPTLVIPVTLRCGLMCHHFTQML